MRKVVNGEKSFFHSLLDVMKGTSYFFKQKELQSFSADGNFATQKNMKLAAVEKGTIKIQLFPIKALLTDFWDEEVLQSSCH